MTLKIHGIARSRAFRALWVAEEAGVPYEHIPTDSKSGAKQPEFLALNPNGRIPAIEDGSFVLFESLAITLYLAKRYSSGKLYPVRLEDEARAWQWSLWGATEIETPLIEMVSNRVVLPPAERNESVAAVAEAKLPRPLAVLDAHLAKPPYLLGETFTVADLNIAALLYSAWYNKIDLSRWPRMTAWLDRCLTRPGAQRARKLREA